MLTSVTSSNGLHSKTMNYVSQGCLLYRVTTGGSIWTYGNGAGNRTATDPLGNVTRVISDKDRGIPLSVQDRLNRTTTFSYDSAFRLASIRHPDGNSELFSYDARGNITETRRKSKTPGTPADIVTTAGYEVSCANPKVCNKPVWTKDAKGNQTDYTYDPNHGGVLSVTAPAPVSGGVRPQTRYSYTSLQAYYKNSAGTIVASGQPIAKLTGISSCTTLASCTGTADDVKTTIDYGPQTAGVGNNLLPVSVSAGSGDGSLTATTAMSYDNVGNLLTVDGPLAGTADTVRYRYDAGRQLVGVIGPDPDGGGALKHRAQRIGYNLDGQVTTVERGTVNGQSDGDWAGSCRSRR